MFLSVLEDLNFADVKRGFFITVDDNGHIFTLKVAISNNISGVLEAVNLTTDFVEGVVPCITNVDLNVMVSCSSLLVVENSHLGNFLGFPKECSPPWSHLHVS